jgi:hypothetical protein
MVPRVIAWCCERVERLDQRLLPLDELTVELGRPIS